MLIDHGLACVELDQVQLVLFFVVTMTQVVYQHESSLNILKSLVMVNLAVNGDDSYVSTKTTIADVVI